MRGALLRSGKIADYDALGEAGTPVHRMAEQVREAIRRKQPALITSLAIPQINQAGDSIDWYAPQTGPVIPWSSSTEEERIPARARLEALKAELDTLSTTLLATQAGTPNSDTALFARLLSRVPYFPDESHVYLVDGEPVLTFWGFDRVGADPTRNPLQCLYPAAPVPAAPVPPAVAPATPIAPAAVVAPLPWWKRWWWLLLLPLLLLLLFGLRGCMTTGSLPLPGSPGWPAWMPFGTPALEAPTVQVPALDVTGARVVTGGNTQVLPGAGPGGAGLADGVQADGTLSPLTEDPDAALPPTAGPDPDAPGADDAHAGAPPPELPQDGTGPDNTQAAPPPLGNETAPADAPGTQPPALSLPPPPGRWARRLPERPMACRCRHSGCPDRETGPAGLSVQGRPRTSDRDARQRTLPGSGVRRHAVRRTAHHPVRPGQLFGRHAIRIAQARMQARGHLGCGLRRRLRQHAVSLEHAPNGDVRPRHSRTVGLSCIPRFQITTTKSV